MCSITIEWIFDSELRASHWRAFQYCSFLSRDILKNSFFNVRINDTWSRVSSWRKKSHLISHKRMMCFCVWIPGASIRREYQIFGWKVGGFEHFFKILWNNEIFWKFFFAQISKASFSLCFKSPPKNIIFCPSKKLINIFCFMFKNII